MYTGIVDHCGTIVKVLTREKGLRLMIECNYEDLILGESISVDGICLTVSEIVENSFLCDISPETAKLTTANFYKVGDKVNLERALRLSDRLGGHFVLGHVDKTYQLTAKSRSNDFVLLTLSGMTEEDKPFILKKGSITVNGVSLTINKITNDSLQVMLIPHTLEKTNLAAQMIGSRVNVEFDWLSRIVVRQLQLGSLQPEQL